MPDKSKEKNEIAILEKNLNRMNYLVFRDYLSEIKSDKFRVKPFGKKGKWNVKNRARAMRLSRIIIDKGEKIIDKLKTLYGSLSGEEVSIAFIIEGKTNKNIISLLVMNKSENDSPIEADNVYETLISALKGNFSGTKIAEEDPAKLASEIIKDILETDSSAISIFSNIATDKSEDFLSQSVEKLLDGFSVKNEKEEYKLILLAESISDKKARELKNYYSNLYTELSPFASFQKNTSVSEISGSFKGINAGVGVDIKKFFPVLPVTLNVSGMAGSSEGTTSQEGQTVTYTRHDIKNALEKIDKQIKRIEQGEALGLWDFSAIAISSEYKTADSITHIFRSLTQGEESYFDKAVINSWNKYIEKDEDAYAEILEYIRAMQNPRFIRNEDEENEFNISTLINGTELAKSFSFPKTSVSGLPVLECARFGRDVHTFSGYAGDLRIGNVYHMHEEEEKPVLLDRNSLTAHTFITGSTGSGKSNTIYTLLNNLCGERNIGDTRFLVIEPAKGEYKHAFGWRKDVSVYGTNPSLGPLLKINPFSFPEGIHVLEHVDRLVEIFNACWPMYAAMPAILKEAIENAYVAKGWRLKKSGHVKPLRFPGFPDLLEQISEIVSSSEYSKDAKGDYEGALKTRVRSLASGLNKEIFSSENEIKDADLFDENVIADISRIGSSETKSLIMGVLVLKLQEYRIANAAGENKELSHITVLEEAHNLLKRTSDAQSQDSSNLQGKSVEMLTNAIAEMRTYGEGFIIADQSPGLLDMAVIRNTNTKIIMRLPDEGDRTLVGKSAGLNENQIAELARLDTGIAAISQNSWIEPVLCKVDRFEGGKKYEPVKPPGDFDETREKLFSVIFALKKFSDLQKEEIEDIKKWLDEARLDSMEKKYINEVLKKKELTERERKIFAYNFFGGKSVTKRFADKIDGDIPANYKFIADRIKNDYDLENEELTKIIILNIIFQARDMLEAGTEKSEFARRIDRIDFGKL